MVQQLWGPQKKTPQNDGTAPVRPGSYSANFSHRIEKTAAVSAFLQPRPRANIASGRLGKQGRDRRRPLTKAFPDFRQKKFRIPGRRGPNSKLQGGGGGGEKNFPAESTEGVGKVIPQPTPSGRPKDRTPTRKSGDAKIQNLTIVWPRDGLSANGFATPTFIPFDVVPREALRPPRVSISIGSYCLAPTCRRNRRIGFESLL